MGTQHEVQRGGTGRAELVMGCVGSRIEVAFVEINEAFR